MIFQTPVEFLSLFIRKVCGNFDIVANLFTRLSSFGDIHWEYVQLKYSSWKPLKLINEESAHVALSFHLLRSSLFSVIPNYEEKTGQNEGEQKQRSCE
jgi:hypothetical protein